MSSPTVGEYRLIAWLGRGGMADVCLAVRGGLVGFEKLLVVKRLRPDLIDHPDAHRYRALLLDEARLAARLAHPGIVQTFEVGEDAGSPFFAMEYLDGQPLHRVLNRARRAGLELPLPIALRIVADVLGALDYAHRLTAPPALRLCGSNTIGAELGPALVEALLRRKGAAQVARVRGARPTELRLTAAVDGRELGIELVAAGTGTAFEGLAAGTCDVGMASRPIHEAEVAALRRAGLGDVRAPATEHVVALDGIAVIVHPNNPLRSLDRAALRAAFTGEVTDWKALGGAPGPITVLARDSHSGTFDTFKHLVLGKTELARAARRFEQSEVLAHEVASDPSAIGFVGLAYVRAAKALATGDRGAPQMLPTSFTVTTEGYMLARRLYLYTPPRPRTPLTAELVSFALSSQGQEVVRAAGFVDLDIVSADAPPCDARCPARYAALVRGARRLSLDLRFRYASDEVDSRATRDLDRLVHFLERHPGSQVVLLGFSDGSGDPAQNTRLSRDRAARIADELATRGVRAAAVEGFGAAMPVTGNQTEADRERNRRVEVWVR